MPKIQFNIELELKKKLKKYCVDNEITITELLITYIKSLIKSKTENH